MGLITINNMEFFAYHGFFEMEQKTGNLFSISVTLETNTIFAELNDDIMGTINYQDIYEIVKREMNITSKLIENVAYRIKKSIFDFDNRILSVQLEIKKINPAIGGKVEFVSFKL